MKLKLTDTMRRKILFTPKDTNKNLTMRPSDVALLVMGGKSTRTNKAMAEYLYQMLRQNLIAIVTYPTKPKTMQECADTSNLYYITELGTKQITESV